MLDKLKNFKFSKSKNDESSSQTEVDGDINQKDKINKKRIFFKIFFNLKLVN